MKNMKVIVLPIIVGILGRYYGCEKLARMKIIVQEDITTF